MVVVVYSLSHVQLFVTPWTTAHQASLSFTISQSSIKFMSLESVMPSNLLIFCHPLLLLPSVFPGIRVFSNESVHLHIWRFWYFSQQSWFQLVIHPTPHFTWCTLCESEVKVKVTQSCPALCDPTDCPWNSLSQITGVGSLSLLQGIFPTQGSNPGLPHCRRILYQLSHKYPV